MDSVEQDSSVAHFPFFISLDGKETKDQAPSKLPPHNLAHPRRWGRPTHRSRDGIEWEVRWWVSVKCGCIVDVLVTPDGLSGRTVRCYK